MCAQSRCFKVLATNVIFLIDLDTVCFSFCLVSAAGGGTGAPTDGVMGSQVRGHGKEREAAQPSGTKEL